jgi:hypothetical protein
MNLNEIFMLIFGIPLLILLVMLFIVWLKKGFVYQQKVEEKQNIR